MNVGDTASGELLANLPGHTTWVNAAVFRPDSLTVRTVSGDGTIRDIRCEVCVSEQDLLALARGKLARITRELSGDERKIYVPAKPCGHRARGDARRARAVHALSRRLSDVARGIED